MLHASFKGEGVVSTQSIEESFSICTQEESHEHKSQFFHPLLSTYTYKQDVNT